MSLNVLDMNNAIYLEEGYCTALLSKVRARSEEFKFPPGFAPGYMPEPADYAVLHERADRYDPQRWYELFSHLRMRSGWVLDFVYSYRGNGGSPWLYARKEAGKRLKTPDELKAMCLHGDSWQKLLETDRSPEGFFEVVVLARVAHRFHRVWHAFADSAEFICDPQSLRAALGPAAPETAQAGRMPPGMEPLTQVQIESLMVSDAQPAVEIGAAGATVTLLSMVLPGGLSRQSYAVCAGSPVTLIGETMLWERRGGPIY